MLFAGAGFLAIGNAGKIVSSPDGSTWTSQQVGSASLTALARSGSQYVAVGNATVATSSDGANWTAQAIK